MKFLLFLWAALVTFLLVFIATGIFYIVNMQNEFAHTRTETIKTATIQALDEYYSNVTSVE